MQTGPSSNPRGRLSSIKISRTAKGFSFRPFSSYYEIAQNLIWKKILTLNIVS